MRNSRSSSWRGGSRCRDRTSRTPTGLLRARAAGAEVGWATTRDGWSSADAVVVSSAIPDSNPEVAEARRRDPGVGAGTGARGPGGGRPDDRRRGDPREDDDDVDAGLVLLERTGLDPTYLVGGEPNESGAGPGRAPATCSSPKPTSRTALPALLRPSRDRHQRRSRPHGLLPRKSARRWRRRSRLPPSNAGTSSRAPTTPGRSGRSAPRPRT